MNKWITRILIIIFFSIFLLSIFYTVKNKWQDKQQNKVFEELENIVTDNQVTDNEEQQEDINLQKLYELNKDFVGWIEIEYTNISYPVMQTDIQRKDYYLHKNFYKKYSQLGTPYIAEYCNVFTSDNLIIYGHHISNYQMI